MTSSIINLSQGGKITNLKTIINIIPFIGVLTMVLWGVLGNAWNISWIAVVIGGVLMVILSIINKSMEKDKKGASDKESDTK